MFLGKTLNCCGDSYHLVIQIGDDELLRVRLGQSDNLALALASWSPARKTADKRELMRLAPNLGNKNS